MRLTLLRTDREGDVSQPVNINLLRVDSATEALDAANKPIGTLLTVGPDEYRVAEPFSMVAKALEDAWDFPTTMHPADAAAASEDIMAKCFTGMLGLFAPKGSPVPAAPSPAPKPAPVYLSHPPGQLTEPPEVAPPAPLDAVPSTLRCRNCRQESALGKCCRHCGAHLVVGEG